MSAIYLLIIASFVVALGFLVAFFWAMRSGQYDDDYTPSVRMLFDDDKIKNQTKPKPKTQNQDS
jgi:cbb3-type cytochrome oxidase maturation protein